MPSQKQASAAKSPKRSVSRPRAGSRGRPRKASPESKSADRPASRGRGRPGRKTDSNVLPRGESRSPSASRGRRLIEDTPRAIGAHDHANANSSSADRRTVEVRTIKAESYSSSAKGRGASKKWTTALWSSLNLDFFGPLGSGALLILLPPVIFAANMICSITTSGTTVKGSCSLQDINIFSNSSRLCAAFSEALNDFQALVFLLVWLVLQGILYLLPIGSVVDGYDPRERLRYRVNLPHAVFLNLGILAFVVGYLNYDIFSFVLTHLLGLIMWSNILAIVGAAALFIAGRKERTSSFGNTGWVVQDFFMGRTRNPRIRRWKWFSMFDFKMFFELRPGLLLWALLAASYLVLHYREVRAKDKATVWYGVPDGFNWNLGLLALFQVWYVFDSQFCEYKILSTFDIVSEGFGFMLLFGDMVFLPFLYPVNLRYLLLAQNNLSSTVQSFPYLATLFVIHTVGYVILRASNNAKHAFRTNPNAPSLQHLRTVTVNSGRKILTGGWWALSRHPNYIGDLLMSWSWALLCGCPPSISAALHIYFYPGFVTVLLVTRAVRDDAVRREKYGEAAWKRYCDQVKWRIIPYVF